MRLMTIEDVARDRLRWAKHLQKENEKLEQMVWETQNHLGHLMDENEKLKEAEYDLYTELSNLYGDNEKLEAEVKRLREMKKWLLENHTQVMLQYTYGRVEEE